MPLRRLLPALSLALAACGGGEEPPPSSLAAPQDPAIARALGQRLMSDPDLSATNEGNALLGATQDGSLPSIDRGGETVERARRMARVLAGVDIPEPQPPYRTGAPIPDGAHFSLLERVAMSPALGDCADRLALSAGWAARLPRAVPIYPLGNTVTAGGVEEDGCDVVAVRFRTGTDRPMVFGFYIAMFRQAGLYVRDQRRGTEWVLTGQAGDRRAVVYVDALSPSGSDVVLVSSGF